MPLQQVIHELNLSASFYAVQRRRMHSVLDDSVRKMNSAVHGCLYAAEPLASSWSFLYDNNE